MEIRKVGVVGAGVMGVGLGQSLAQNGLEAVLVDITQDVLDHARGEIRRGLRFQGMFQKSERRESSDAVLARIFFTTDLAALADVDFVVENVPEKWELKAEIYPRLDAVCPERAVFAVNTSCISIRGHHTSDSTLATARELLRLMGKDCIVVGDLPGFVSNRILMLTVNEAVCVLQDGVATAEQVDQLFKTCFGHKMGPLETADLIGLDTILYSIEVLYDSYNDSKFRPSPLLRRMVDAGLLGRKSGKGFYDYGLAG